MSHSMRDVQFAPEEFQSYVAEIVIETLRNGTILPSTLLECIYYSVEPDLLAAIRVFAATGPAERLMIMSYAKRLSEERVTVG
jgi:hypothetical protein